MKRRRHTADEIAAKLRLADDLALRGKRQAEIARALGVSLMTYRRWREAQSKRSGAAGPPSPSVPSSPADSRLSTISTLAVTQDALLENARLRRLVVDLLLEESLLRQALARQPGASPGAKG